MHLSAITSPDQVLALLRLDEPLALAKILALDLSQLEQVNILRRVQSILVKILSPYTSGLILEPLYTLDLASTKAVESGILLRLEQEKTFSPLMVPELWPDFSLAEIKNNYALAKLTLAYHPQEEQALAKKQLLAEIKEYCQFLNIDFVLDLKITDLAALNAKNQPPIMDKATSPAPSAFSGQNISTTQVLSFAEAQLIAVQELQTLVDAFILEYPGDPLLTATLTTQLDVPWLLTASLDQKYADFKEVFREVMANGARGFVLADTLWLELGQFPVTKADFVWADLEKFIAETVKDRVLELKRIATEALADINS